jgi:hypothetical protein
MAVRGEEVASAIDSHIREALEKMVGEIRSSVEDVRDAVDQQLKAALQSVQADVNSTTFLPFIQKTLTDLQESIEAERPVVEAPPPAPVAAPAAASSAGRVKRAIQTIERGKSQVDILNSMLEQSLEFGSRAALLILRGETFSGWKGVGFSAHGGNDEMIKRFNAAPGLIAELDHVLRDERVVKWDGGNLATRFGVAAPQNAILVPMVIKDKVAAAVYVDATQEDESKFDATSVELLVFATGLLVDTLAIRKKSPSPSLSDESGEAAAAVSAPAPRPTPPPASIAPPAPQPAPAPAPPPRVIDTPPETGTVAISAAQMRELMAKPGPGFNVPAAEEFAAPAPAPRPVAPPPPPPPPPPVAPPMPDEGRPSTQFIPPAGITPRGLAAGPKDEEQKKHDEARRFARLLVSEIKLYNETKVDAGRKNKDLYERLKEDIDRSRQMYDERVPDEVRKSSNYFYDELVRILADGQADALGL